MQDPAKQSNSLSPEKASVGYAVRESGYCCSGDHDGFYA